MCYISEKNEFNTALGNEKSKMYFVKESILYVLVVVEKKRVLVPLSIAESC